MPELNFFTPLSYKSGASWLERVDDYFALGTKKAIILEGRTKHGKEKAILTESKSSLVTKIAKVLSYFTVVIPLFILAAKAILRSQHSFKLIDPKQKLEEGINISADTVGKIQALMPKILNGKQDDQIQWLTTGHTLVFKLKEKPELVFKIAPPNHFHGDDKLPTYLEDKNPKASTRFENMVKAKEICLTNQLGLLVIPHAKKLTINADGNDYAFIVEESLDFDREESCQEEAYHQYSAELNETSRELAAFVAEGGFIIGAWRHIPLMKEAVDFRGPRRVALIDLESLGSPSVGFLGETSWLKNGRRGLIASVSEAQIDIVIAEARKRGIITETEAQEAKKRRLDELESDKKLKIFYETKGIVTGKEPLQVDVDTLGLDLTEEAQVHVFVRGADGKKHVEEQTVTLRKAAEDVITQINKLIQKRPDQASTKGKRKILLKASNPPFSGYNGVGFVNGQVSCELEDQKQVWLYRIIQALVDKGHLFKLEKVNNHGYFIQA